MIRTHLRTSRKRVSMRATNSPQTWGTSTLKPVDNDDA
jgi:hypothetical protein